MKDRGLRAAQAALFALSAAACGTPPAAPPHSPAARNLLIITIDTLRADRVGVYGHAAARTPGMDALARSGVRFDRAFAVAPITLPSHASIMTGRYPPGHGARHNGIRIDPAVPTLAETLKRAGFATGAFVGAFPLDRRFGLDRGFDQYGDRMPRGAPGQPVNERPGREVADEAVAWLQAHRTSPFFLWVHFFEPHAPYGDARGGRPVAERYDDEVAEADLQIRRVLDAVGEARAATIVAVTADHGEAFGEHGEIAHSVFVYDTTLRVPLVVSGPSIAPGVVQAPVSLVDLAPTLLRRLGIQGFDADGIDLGPALAGGVLPTRDLYAESFAPLLDFGWSPLRSIRAEGWKFIEAPSAELYDVSGDPGEGRDRARDETARVAAMSQRLARYNAPPPRADADQESRARLQALGYVGGGATAGSARPDPKDRRQLAARLAQVTSGELHGQPLESALREVLKLDAKNPLAHLRLGYVLQESSRCGEAMRHFQQAIDARFPSADAYLGLASCQTQARRFDAAAATLRAGDRAEPDNPVVAANLGLVLSDAGRPAEGIPHLQRAVTLDPAFDQARFYLAIAFARAGRREDAAREAATLLERLPSDAPQRAEVQRLIAALK
jgi:arylsulfatase A-like enzyme/cytochrome c-type biogenesis protein CcmH/NrfG